MNDCVDHARALLKAAPKILIRPVPSDTSGLMDTYRTAEWLGCDPYTLRNWARQGLIPCYRLPGRNGRFRFDPLEMLDWLRSE